MEAERGKGAASEQRGQGFQWWVAFTIETTMMTMMMAMAKPMISLI